VIISCKK